MTMMRTSTRAWRLMWVSASVWLSACATTGDPRAGGFFAWSEDQAKARQDALLREDANAQGQLRQEQQRAASLKAQQDGLGSEAAKLQAELTRLVAENDGLDTRLRALMQRRQLGTEQAARLRSMLADNQRIRAASALPAAGSAPALKQVEAVSDQNRRLHREVMILLE
jgi:septal ring factor EnvC (AmiA/AmiB activator)